MENYFSITVTVHNQEASCICYEQRILLSRQTFDVIWKFPGQFYD